MLGISPVPGGWWQNLSEGAEREDATHRDQRKGPGPRENHGRARCEEPETGRMEVRELMAEREEGIQENLKEKTEGERKRYKRQKERLRKGEGE